MKEVANERDGSQFKVYNKMHAGTLLLAGLKLPSSEESTMHKRTRYDRRLGHKVQYSSFLLCINTISNTDILALSS